MLHVSSKWKMLLQFHSYDMTLRAGAGLLFRESLRWENTFKMESIHFRTCIPTELLIT